MNELRKLTTDIALAYAGRTMKTVSRDLNQLEELELIRRKDRSTVRANGEMLLSFLPLTVEDPVDEDEFHVGEEHEQPTLPFDS